MPIDDSFKYSAKDNLDAMKHAINYNNMLLSKILNNKPDCSGPILDFGAGSGQFAEMIRVECKAPICIEKDTDFLLSLTARGFHTFKDLSAIESHTISYVYSLNCLEHIEHDQASIREIYRVLKPGGKGFIYVPAIQYLYSAMDSYVGHYRRYGKRDLKLKFEGAGFKINRIEYVDSLGVLASLYLKYVAPPGTGGALNPTAVSFYDRIVFPISQKADILFRYIIGKNLLLIVSK